MAKTDSQNAFPGDVFKSAREAKGLTIETVHEITKIPMDVLKAIEEGYTVRSVSPFYMQGFRKMYAKHLDLDLSREIKAGPRSPNPAPVKKPEPFQHPKPRPLPPVREEEFPDRFEAMFSRERQRQIIKITGFLILLFLIFRIGGCLFHRRTSDQGPAEVKKAVPVKKKVKASAKTAEKKEPRKTASKKAAESPLVVDPPPAAEPVPQAAAVVLKPPPEPQAVAASAPAAEASAPVFSKPVNLTVKAGKSGWLQVKVDGVLVFQSTLKEGSSETWQAEEMIELSGKNIHNLEFEVNGKLIGGLGRADRSARKVVVTKNGLSVKM